MTSSSDQMGEWLRTITGNFQVREVLITKCANQLETLRGRTAVEAKALADGVWASCLYQAGGDMHTALRLMREEIKRLEHQTPP